MSQPTFAEKLSAIYAAKLAIREAIKTKGVPLSSTEPFSEYATKILLIKDEGSGSGETGGVVSIRGMSDNFSFEYILPQTLNITDVAALIAEAVGSDEFTLNYPPMSGAIIAESARAKSIGAPDENVAVVYTLFAFAESFNLQTARKYSYNADWVEFSERGVYLRDRVMENSGSFQGATENGVYFSSPFPNRQSYGQLNAITAGLEAENG